MKDGDQAVALRATLRGGRRRRRRSSWCLGANGLVSAGTDTEQRLVTVAPNSEDAACGGPLPG